MTRIWFEAAARKSRVLEVKVINLSSTRSARSRQAGLGWCRTDLRCSTWTKTGSSIWKTQFNGFVQVSVETEGTCGRITPTVGVRVLRDLFYLSYPRRPNACQPIDASSSCKYRLDCHVTSGRVIMVCCQTIFRTCSNRRCAFCPPAHMYRLLSGLLVGPIV